MATIRQLNLINTRNAFALVFVCLCAALLYGVFRPEAPKEYFLHSDKVAHILIFFAVTLSGRLAAPNWSQWKYWLVWLSLAAALEYLQGVLWATRMFSIEDAYANIAGVCAAFVIWRLIQIVLPRLFAPNEK